MIGLILRTQLVQLRVCVYLQAHFYPQVSSIAGVIVYFFVNPKLILPIRIHEELFPFLH